jgi:hypothetical protein
MTRMTCDEVRDLLPEMAREGPPAADRPALEEHLRTCQDCRIELEVLRVVRGALDSSLQVPAGLEARIQDRIREELPEAAGGRAGLGSGEPVGKVVPLFPRRLRPPAWALSAAAVVILGLGTAIILHERGPDLVQDPIVVVASQDPVPEAWLMDDGMVAGAPVFDGLSDEDLEALLEEFGG